MQKVQFGKTMMKRMAGTPFRTVQFRSVQAAASTAKTGGTDTFPGGAFGMAQKAPFPSLNVGSQSLIPNGSYAEAQAEYLQPDVPRAASLAELCKKKNVEKNSRFASKNENFVPFGGKILIF
jgi:membrane protease subunit (stomatin/prohibitin family)